MFEVHKYKAQFQKFDPYQQNQTLADIVYSIPTNPRPEDIIDFKSILEGQNFDIKQVSDNALNHLPHFLNIYMPALEVERLRYLSTRRLLARVKALVPLSRGSNVYKDRVHKSVFDMIVSGVHNDQSFREQAEALKADGLKIKYFSVRDLEALKQELDLIEEGKTGLFHPDSALTLERAAYRAEKSKHGQIIASWWNLGHTSKVQALQHNPDLDRWKKSFNRHFQQSL